MIDCTFFRNSGNSLVLALTLLTYFGAFIYSQTKDSFSIKFSTCAFGGLAPSSQMRLCQPPDGNTNPKYKLLCFITTKKFCKEKNALAFNRDKCCHLVLCLQLIPFHCRNYNEGPLAGKAGWKNDLSITPITNFYILANEFFEIRQNHLH